MAQLNANIDGTLTIAPEKSQPAVPAQSSGCTFGISIVQDVHKAPSGEISQSRASIESPSAYVAMPFPANLTARVFYLRTISGGPFDIRLTHATTGQVVTPARYSMLTEVSETEQITAVDVQGQGSFEWAAFGPTT